MQFVKAQRYILLFFVLFCLFIISKERERERAFFKSSMKKIKSVLPLSIRIFLSFLGPLVVMHQLSVVAGWCNASLDSEREATSPPLAMEAGEEEEEGQMRRRRHEIKNVGGIKRKSVFSRKREREEEEENTSVLPGRRARTEERK